MGTFAEAIGSGSSERATERVVQIEASRIVAIFGLGRQRADDGQGEPLRNFDF